RQVLHPARRLARLVEQVPRDDLLDRHRDRPPRPRRPVGELVVLETPPLVELVEAVEPQVQRQIDREVPPQEFGLVGWAEPEAAHEALASIPAPAPSQRRTLRFTE